MTWDPSTDFEDIVDGLEAVTLSVSGIADQAIANAHRNEVTNAEIEASNGQTRKGDTVWQWPVSESPTRPLLGSTLTDGDARVWTIREISEQVLSSKFSAVCRELAVEVNANTLITIQIATYVKGIHGAAEPTWATAFANVRARVQPISQTPQVEHDADEATLLYRITLEADLSIDVVRANYRVVDATNAVYLIVSYQGAEQIDMLPTIMAEKQIETSSSGSSG